MKRLLVSALTVAAFIAYALFARSDTSAVATPSVSSSSQEPRPVTKSTASTDPQPSSPSTANASATYKDGVYTGDAADAYYGFVQIRASVQNGKLTDVAFLRYPNDRQTSLMINRQVMPMLHQEAIAAQTARVDIISGATDTSQAFIQSLGSALIQARIQ